MYTAYEMNSWRLDGIHSSILFECSVKNEKTYHSECAWLKLSLLLQLRKKINCASVAPIMRQIKHGFPQNGTNQMVYDGSVTYYCRYSVAFLQYWLTELAKCLKWKKETFPSGLLCKLLAATELNYVLATQNTIHIVYLLLVVVPCTCNLNLDKGFAKVYKWVDIIHLWQISLVSLSWVDRIEIKNNSF